jgi:HD-like signal output (HDOD) protein/ActR/RegA family two-component response regulator
MKVMFVDDEIMILNGFKRAFFKNEWQIYLADSADKALKILEKQPIDFIISDMRMPGMNGAEFLEKVAALYPQSVRIILSGHSDEEAAKRATFVAHQWFSKPCNPKGLEKVINHIADIRNSLPNPSVRNTVGQIKSLPTPPKVFMRLSALLNEKSLSMEQVSDVISEEPSLIAKILQITNTSFFVNARHVESINEAITRLGIDLVCSVVMAAEAYSNVEETPGYSIVDEQNHCLSTARFAASMVEPSLRKETILVGLLHNIGKCILSKISPESMDAYIKQRVIGGGNIDLEQKLFMADHTQLAGYLLHLWNFSYSLIENIVLHHQPVKLMEKSFGSGAAVYVASRIIREQTVDEAFVEHFNIADKLEVWQSKYVNYL